MPDDDACTCGYGEIDGSHAVGCPAPPSVVEGPLGTERKTNPFEGTVYERTYQGTWETRVLDEGNGDPLHPFGRCTCQGEGRCPWCARPCAVCGNGAARCVCDYGPTYVQKMSPDLAADFDRIDEAAKDQMFIGVDFAVGPGSTAFVKREKATGHIIDMEIIDDPILEHPDSPELKVVGGTEAPALVPKKCSLFTCTRTSEYVVVLLLRPRNYQGRPIRMRCGLQVCRHCRFPIPDKFITEESWQRLLAHFDRRNMARPHRILTDVEYVPIGEDQDLDGFE